MPFGLAPVVVLTFVTIAETASAAIVPGTLPRLQDEFGFGDAAGGAIPLAAVLVGALFLLPAGYVTDHFRRTRVLALAMFTMAAVVLASALAVSFAMLFALQIAFGTANTFDNPALNSVLVDYYAPSVRGRLFAVQRFGFVIGFAVGVAVAGAVGDAFGWRWSFVALAPVLVVAAISALALPEPRRGGLDREPGTESRSDAAVGALDETVEAEVELEHQRSGWRQYAADTTRLWRIDTARLLVVGQLVATFGFNGLSFWLTSFFERTHDLSGGAAAALTGLVGVVAGLGGSLGGGIIGDRLNTRDPRLRITFIAASLGVGSVLIALGLGLPALLPQVAFVLLGGAGATAAIPNLGAAFADVLPGSRRGTGFALYFLVSALGFALGPLFMGAGSAMTGSLRTGMIVAMVVSIPGALLTLRGRATVVRDTANARGTSS